MNLKNNLLVILGAVLGGLLGYLGFMWLVRQGFYALILPGGLVGIGAGIFKTPSKYIAVICGLLALALGCFTEWHFSPFLADAGLPYFLSHLHHLQPVTLIMIALGTLLGSWIPFRRSQDQ